MKVTIDDIARMANVSKATVSRVINDKKEGVGEATRKRVKKIIQEMDYNPNLLARGIVTSKTRTVGLILPDLLNPFFPALVKAVEDYCSQQNYTVLLCNTDGREKKEESCIRTLISKRVDGIILTTTTASPGEMHWKMADYTIPCVLLDRKMDALDCVAGVFTDNEYAIFTAAEYLIRHGNRRIAFISGPRELSTSVERLQGYYTASRQYGIPADENLIRYAAFSLEGGYNAVRDLSVSGVDFTAIILGNDLMAIGAMKFLRETGRHIPRDVEVIGFDNIEICTAIEPQLTTIQQPTHDLGKRAAQILLEAINGKYPSERFFRLMPKLILRGTTRRDVKFWETQKF